jgi:hypothetical protein
VKQQSAHISAEWLLLLGCLLRRGSGSSSDLGISWALLHADVGRGDRCQSDRCRGGDGQWRDMAQFHLLSSYLGDIARYGGGLHVSAGLDIGHLSVIPSEAVVGLQLREDECIGPLPLRNCESAWLSSYLRQSRDSKYRKVL